LSNIDNIDNEYQNQSIKINKCEKPYDNYYVLDYIFIGHTNNIVDLFYHEESKLLYSSSMDNSMKIWDLTVR